jgi:hypothetical protein
MSRFVNKFLNTDEAANERISSSATCGATRRVLSSPEAKQFRRKGSPSGQGCNLYPGSNVMVLESDFG